MKKTRASWKQLACMIVLALVALPGLAFVGSSAFLSEDDPAFSEIGASDLVATLAWAENQPTAVPADEETVPTLKNWEDTFFSPFSASKFIRVRFPGRRPHRLPRAAYSFAFSVYHGGH